MHRLGARVGLLVLVLLLGCAAAATKVGPSSPVNALRVQVREFDLRGAYITDWVGSTDTYGFLVAERIARGLQERGVDAHATAMDAAVVAEGKVVTIDGGSRALRYWVSFGAGATRFAVDGRAVKADGRTLGEFADERRSGVGFFGGEYDLLLKKCAGAVGEDVAEMIVTGDYRRTF